jgi:mannitol/fructose-specific phosphotransferase system IIA component (Ntr-type)
MQNVAGHKVKLSELVVPEAIKIPVSSKTKPKVIEELVSLLENAHSLSSDGEILQKVVERESMMSTGIGNGVAIPHAKSKRVDRLVAACGVSDAGIDFESFDGEPAWLFILLISPEEIRGPHVRALANISRLLKDAEVRADLRKAGNTDTFMRILLEAEARYL